ncbi:MAG: hypothetical protein ABWZ52_04990 [Acidimicrobiales bacterium]
MKRAPVVVSVAAAYGLLQWLGRTHGATRAERDRHMPGDDLCTHPQVVTNHATTINARPERVWPWLVQVGWGRGGWYTARWVDRLLFPANGPSADRIAPELQHLAVGDRILDGPPEANCAFTVEQLEPPRHFVLRSRDHLPPGWKERFGATIDFTWAFVLTDLGNGRTRFTFRCRARTAPQWVAAAYEAVMVPADFVMSRQMLRGIRERAERAAGPVLPGPDPFEGLERSDPGTCSMDLYWIPLGAGASVVRASGRLYERLASVVARREPRPLFHSALVAHIPGRTVTIEMAPIPDARGHADRGVVAEGAVGSRMLARLRVFRYEVRRWTGGVIPDLPNAVGGPVRVAEDAATVHEILRLLEKVPTPVWGRDELRTADMWNSNSVVSWALTGAGVVEAAGRPPGDGRAPGWDAGVVEAQRAVGVIGVLQPLVG